MLTSFRSKLEQEKEAAKTSDRRIAKQIEDVKTLYTQRRESVRIKEDTLVNISPICSSPYLPSTVFLFSVSE
jgi:hypothetical protein